MSLLASSKGAECSVEITQLCCVSPIESIWRRLRRVLPFYRHLTKSKRKRLGLSWHLFFTDLQQAYQLVGKVRDDKPLHAYEEWLANFDTLEPAEYKLIKRQLARWGSLPRFCLHLVGEGDEQARKQTLESIQALSYPTSHIRLQEHDAFSVIASPPLGEWQWVLPVGTLVSPSALFWVAHQLRQNPDCLWIYGDHDLLDERGKRHSPNFKPDWNETLLQSQNYIGWCGLWREQGASRVPFDAAACHQWWLQLAQQYEPNQIAHIPSLMMHLPASALLSNDCDPLKDKEDLLPSGVIIEAAPHGICRWRWPLPTQLPLVSVIIPTRNGLAHLRPCIESLINKTHYTNMDIMVMDNQSDDEETLAYLAHITQVYGVRVIAYDQPFNYSAINNLAVRQARGDLVCLLNNDTEVISSDWLDEMVSHLLRPGVGVVGAKLYYGNGLIQHAGDAVGPGGCADHLHNGLSANDSGYQRRAVSAQELSAVTAACLLTHKDLYLALGGLDETHLPIAFNDVDYCLRVREAGRRIIWTPFAELYHHESISRGKDVSTQQQRRAKSELRYMKRRWACVLNHDPAYNPNLSYERPDFSLSRAPNMVLPWMN
ncbi:glycosyltransferase family 2 protein [Aeromonas hydrophila]|uniref:glycosyltransferase family 2 protein n=1 Tax=Aeromonas hydrophila TaxID=644 RepID=UPI001EFA1B55|nr:glycosyltransferase family 2 protein [Aeromonas hydrophila]